MTAAHARDRTRPRVTRGSVAHMRKYLFGTGLLNSYITGKPLFENLRDGGPFTWRTALAWVSWILTFALAIGAIIDVYRASRGMIVPDDSPVAGQEPELLARRLHK